MVWNRNRDVSLVNDLEIFLGDLCSEWDFCGGASAVDLVANGKILRSLDFTNAVLIAEGMNPKNEVNWGRRIKRKFVQRYGQSVSIMSHHV